MTSGKSLLSGPGGLQETWDQGVGVSVGGPERRGLQGCDAVLLEVGVLCSFGLNHLQFIHV